MSVRLLGEFRQSTMSHTEASKNNSEHFGEYFWLAYDIRGSFVKALTVILRPRKVILGNLGVFLVKPPFTFITLAREV